MEGSNFHFYSSFIKIFKIKGHLIIGLCIKKFWATPENSHFGEKGNAVIVTKKFTFISYKSVLS